MRRDPPEVQEQPPQQPANQQQPLFQAQPRQSPVGNWIGILFIIITLLCIGALLYILIGQGPIQRSLPSQAIGVNGGDPPASASDVTSNANDNNNNGANALAALRQNRPKPPPPVGSASVVVSTSVWNSQGWCCGGDGGPGGCGGCNNQGYNWNTNAWCPSHEKPAPLPPGSCACKWGGSSANVGCGGQQNCYTSISSSLNCTRNYPWLVGITGNSTVPTVGTGTGAATSVTVSPAFTVTANVSPTSQTTLDLTTNVSLVLTNAGNCTATISSILVLLEQVGGFPSTFPPCYAYGNSYCCGGDNQTPHPPQLWAASCGQNQPFVGKCAQSGVARICDGTWSWNNAYFGCGANVSCTPNTLFTNASLTTLINVSAISVPAFSTQCKQAVVVNFTVDFRLNSSAAAALLALAATGQAQFRVSVLTTYIACCARSNTMCGLDLDCDGDLDVANTAIARSVTITLPKAIPCASRCGCIGPDPYALSTSLISPAPPTACTLSSTGVPPSGSNVLPSNTCTNTTSLIATVDACNTTACACAGTGTYGANVLASLAALTCRDPVTGNNLITQTPSSALDKFNCRYPTPINCVVSTWSAWSTCGPTTSNPCNQTQTRTITTQPCHGGVACPVLSQSMPCTTLGGQCPYTSNVTLISGCNATAGQCQQQYVNMTSSSAPSVCRSGSVVSCPPLSATFSVPCTTNGGFCVYTSIITTLVPCNPSAGVCMSLMQKVTTSSAAIVCNNGSVVSCPNSTANFSTNCANSICTYNNGPSSIINVMGNCAPPACSLAAQNTTAPDQLDYCLSGVPSTCSNQTTNISIPCTTSGITSNGCMYNPPQITTSGNCLEDVCRGCLLMNEGNGGAEEQCCTTVVHPCSQFIGNTTTPVNPSFCYNGNNTMCPTLMNTTISSCGFGCIPLSMGPWSAFGICSSDNSSATGCSHNRTAFSQGYSCDTESACTVLETDNEPCTCPCAYASSCTYNNGPSSIVNESSVCDLSSCEAEAENTTLPDEPFYCLPNGTVIPCANATVAVNVSCTVESCMYDVWTPWTAWSSCSPAPVGPTCIHTRTRGQTLIPSACYDPAIEPCPRGPQQVDRTTCPCPCTPITCDAYFAANAGNYECTNGNITVDDGCGDFIECELECTDPSMPGCLAPFGSPYGNCICSQTNTSNASALCDTCAANTIGSAFCNVTTGNCVLLAESSCSGSGTCSFPPGDACQIGTATCINGQCVCAVANPTPGSNDTCPCFTSPDSCTNANANLTCNPVSLQCCEPLTCDLYEEINGPVSCTPSGITVDDGCKGTITCGAGSDCILSTWSCFSVISGQCGNSLSQGLTIERQATLITPASGCGTCNSTCGTYVDTNGTIIDTRVIPCQNATGNAAICSDVCPYDIVSNWLNTGQFGVVFANCSNACPVGSSPTLTSESVVGHGSYSLSTCCCEPLTCDAFFATNNTGDYACINGSISVPDGCGGSLSCSLACPGAAVCEIEPGSVFGNCTKYCLPAAGNGAVDICTLDDNTTVCDPIQHGCIDSASVPCTITADCAQSSPVNFTSACGGITVCVDGICGCNGSVCASPGGIGSATLDACTQNNTETICSPDMTCVGPFPCTAVNNCTRGEFYRNCGGATSCNSVSCQCTLTMCTPTLGSGLDGCSTSDSTQVCDNISGTCCGASTCNSVGDCGFSSSCTSASFTANCGGTTSCVGGICMCM